MLHFFCDERKICSTIKKSQNIYIMNIIENFILLLMSLLTALIVKNILAVIYFIFLKKALTKFGSLRKAWKNSYLSSKKS